MKRQPLSHIGNAGPEKAPQGALEMAELVGASQSQLEPLAVDEATMAGLLGVSPEHLGNLTREGRVPALKFGRRTLYSVRAMCDFLYERAMRNVAEQEAGRAADG